jgi:transmembrane protein EpsG
MLPYFILLLMVVFLAFLGENAKKSTKTYNFYKFLILLFLTLFAGLRSWRVGSDTSGYAHKFEDLNLDFSSFIELESKTEIGYRLLEYITSLFSNDYMLILTVIALVAVFFQLKSIYKLSEQPVISIFILITFGIYTYVFNGARQAIAAAIFMYAVTFLIKSDFRKYLFWVLVAFLFHKSVIFGLPLYFVFRRRFTFKWFIILIIGAALASFFFSLLFQFAGVVSERYSKYEEITTQGGATLTLSYGLLCAFFILMRSKIEPIYLRSYDIYLNMFSFGTIIFILVFFLGAYVEITRLAFYFILSAIFIWPIIFKSLKQNEIFLFLVFFVLVHFTFYYTFVGKMAGLNPYILNPIFN